MADYAQKNKLAEVGFLDWRLSDEHIAKAIEVSDVLIIRPSQDSIETIGYARLLKNKKPIIADIDDTLDDISPFSDSYQSMGVSEVKLKDGTWLWKDDDKHFSIQHNQHRIDAIKEALRRVTGVTVTTFELRDYALQFNEVVSVIPNSINPDLFPTLDLKPKPTVRLLWAGGSSHYADLAEIAPTLQELMYKHLNLELVLAGVSFKGITKDLPHNRVKTAGWITPDGHGFRLATFGADIGICPLTEDKFNTYKSSLKFYEYSALRIPTVAKGILPYAEDIVDGQNGFLYQTQAEFRDKLEQLITDPILRTTMAQNAYKYVMENRSIDKITKDWVKFLEGVVAAYGKK